MMGECIKFGRGKIELYKPKFADNSWSNIITACQTDAVPDTWKVGDQKAMTINGADYLIDIIGKNHDDYSDGSGKAPLTFQLHDCYATTYTMNSSNANAGGWSNSAMRTTHLTAIKALMPPEIQAALRKVNKLTSIGSASSTIFTTADDLFLLSEIEVMGYVSNSWSGEGSRYKYYDTTSNRAKKRNGSAVSWWTRSPYKSSTAMWVGINTSGGVSNLGAINSLSVAPAFCF